MEPKDSYVTSPTEDEALAFIKEIKQVFLDDEDGQLKYDYFFSAMENYKFGRISFENLLATAEEIFEHHEVVFSGFKKYVLKGQETDQNLMIPCTNMHEHSVSKSNDEACKKYMEKVKHRFENNPSVYNSFLTILEDYGNGKNNLVQVYQKIFKLFIGHTDLLEEFEYFWGDLDKETRGKIEEAENYIMDYQLSKVQQLLLKGSKELELVDLVYKCSDLVSKDDSIKDIDQYFTEDKLTSLKALFHEENIELNKAIENHAIKFFAVINPRLKTQADIESGVLSSKLQFWKKNIEPIARFGPCFMHSCNK